MERRFEYLAQVGIVLILVAGCLLVISPFLAAMLLAAVVCISTWPMYEWLLRRLKGRKNIAALGMTLALILVVILPLALVAYNLSDNVAALYVFVKQIVEGGPMEPPAWVIGIPLAGKSLNEYWHLIANNHDEMVALTTRFLDPTKDFLLASGMMLGQGVLEMSLSVFVSFFFYRDGVALMNFLNAAMFRLAGAQAENTLVIINQTVRSVMYGLLGAALAQGFVATIGFLIAGVPGALMLGVATATLSLIPIGPPLIWGGAVIWLFYQGAVAWGIFMLLWGLVLISGVDNMVLPLLLSRDSSLPFILILLGVMGGVIAFGFVGIFLGPTLLAVGMSLLQQWSARPTFTSKNQQL